MRRFALAFVTCMLSLNGTQAMAQHVMPGEPNGVTKSRSGPPASLHGDTNGNFTGRSRGEGATGYLTPEQQAMLAREPGGKLEMKKLKFMSQNDRLKLQTRLQKRWDDLSEKEKGRLRNQLAGKMTQQTNGIR